MGTRYFGDYEDNAMRKKPQDNDLLKNGWRPLYRQIDLDFLWELVSKDPIKLTQQTLNLASNLADNLGRKDYTWWANILNLFSENARYDLDEYWDYITPEPPAPDRHHKDILSMESPVVQMVSRDMIPMDFVLKRLEEIIIFKILDFLGKPAEIIQSYEERHFYYPIDRFRKWENLETIGTILAFWPGQDVWLQIDSAGVNRKRYTLIAKELAPLINKATYNLAVMLSGYHSRVGTIHSEYPIRTFPPDIQNLSDRVQQEVLDQDRLAVLVQGKPGTGKTAWTQAVAREILAPLGYVIFILDHDAVENFVPPNHLERIAIIINEADNLAQDRGSEAAQHTSKTEHILGLLDGTLYRSVIEENGIQSGQRLVVLMTCNTTERLDPAFLRKGRVDIMYEFSHQFV
ncbi:MAG: AAA family ATPase [Oscillatoria sp. SIO1A7]|nr:AAA family ATPase [Oscillatoria sp. SIO1A7]